MQARLGFRILGRVVLVLPDHVGHFDAGISRLVFCALLFELLSQSLILRLGHRLLFHLLANRSLILLRQSYRLLGGGPILVVRESALSMLLQPVDVGLRSGQIMPRGGDWRLAALLSCAHLAVRIMS